LALDYQHSDYVSNVWMGAASGAIDSSDLSLSPARCDHSATILNTMTLRIRPARSLFANAFVDLADANHWSIEPTDATFIIAYAIRKVAERARWGNMAEHFPVIDVIGSVSIYITIIFNTV